MVSRRSSRRPRRPAPRAGSSSPSTPCSSLRPFRNWPGLADGVVAEHRRSGASVSDSAPIVLIDPSVDSPSSLAGRLRMQGYAVAEARAPADGARLALADPPAAVIADLWMPSISGVQLCRLLKAEPATEHTPVILRGPDSPRNRFWAERAGASAYVVKGRMGDLVRTLRDAIAAAPASSGFFTTFAGEDIRERIAAHLDEALFESVLSGELRAL